jgi:dolichol kinase
MHFAWGILFASLNHFIPRTTFLPLMSGLTAITLFMELMRYREGFQWINSSMHYLFGASLRKSEMDGKFTGSLYYFAGVTATSYLYPKSCATLGIIQLAIADPTASYFGRATRHVYWSRINKGFAGGLGRNKGILGFLGGAVACVPLNYRILSLACNVSGAAAIAKQISNPTIFIASLVLGLAGAFADLIVPTPALTLPKTIMGKSVPPFHLDDNFIVPVLSGYACTQIFKYILGVPTMIIPLSKYLIV